MSKLTRIDGVAHAANILVCVGGLATATGVLAGVGAAISGFLSWREIANTLSGPLDHIGFEIGKSLEARLNDERRALSTDQRLLILQMIEAGKPTPEQIMDAGLGGDGLVDIMLCQMTVPDHQTVAIQSTFRAIVAPLLDQLLSDRSFVEQLAPAFQRRVLSEFRRISDALEGIRTEVGSLAEGLQQIRRLTRDQLEALAVRFEIENIFDRSDSELRLLLDQKAQEYRNYRQYSESLDQTLKTLASERATGRAALAALDFNAFENSAKRETEAAAELLSASWQLRGSCALLLGTASVADARFRNSAAVWSRIDKKEWLSRTSNAITTLRDYGANNRNTAALNAAMTLAKEFCAITAKDAESPSKVQALFEEQYAVCIQEIGFARDRIEGRAKIQKAFRLLGALYERHVADENYDQAAILVALMLQNRSRFGLRISGSAGKQIVEEALAAAEAFLVEHGEKVGNEQILLHEAVGLAQVGALRADIFLGENHLKRCNLHLVLALEYYAERDHGRAASVSDGLAYMYRRLAQHDPARRDKAFHNCFQYHHAAIGQALQAENPRLLAGVAFEMSRSRLVQADLAESESDRFSAIREFRHIQAEGLKLSQDISDHDLIERFSALGRLVDQLEQDCAKTDRGSAHTANVESPR